ncbi:hypothetical protein [Caudoviricetes sp.]|nr:hypothetical protein [Caudoviricetes sp.]
MAYQKLQVSRAKLVYPNDNYNYPNPSLHKLTSMETGGMAGAQVVDATVDFITLGIQIGDVITNDNSTDYTVVTEVVDANTLNVADAIFTGGDDYSIYAYNQYEASVLYVGTGGDVEVQTFGGDVVTFKNVNSGQFLPVQAMRIKTGTVATDIIALW